MNNCWIVLMKGGRGSHVHHRPGCALVKALQKAGWQIARIYRAQDPEGDQAVAGSCCCSKGYIPVWPSLVNQGPDEA